MINDADKRLIEEGGRNAGFADTDFGPFLQMVLFQTLLYHLPNAHLFMHLHVYTCI